MTQVFLLTGDCVELLQSFPDNSIDAVVTDPPYGLSKQPDMIEVLRHWIAAELRQHAEKVFRAHGSSLRGSADRAAELYPDEPHEQRGGGFMGKKWDRFVPGPEVWREVFRVLKPGGHLLAFFAPRTQDLGALAIRLAGFEIRDCLAWLYGQGFPKSMNVALAIDKAAGIQGDRGARFSVAGETPGERFDGEAGAAEAYVAPEGTPGAAWQGWGTALKPALEPIVLARKPLDGTVVANVLAHGTGALNVDGCRIPTVDSWTGSVTSSPPSVSLSGGADGSLNNRSSDSHPDGRWPANVVLDDEAAALLDAETGDANDPSRFFYVAKASKREKEAGLEGFPTQSAGELTGGRKEGSAGLNNPRAGAGRTSKGRANTHPTVKPIALMRWLVRLVTPPGGTVLDPFAGSGTTGIAAVLEGFHFVGCELDPAHVQIAEARIEHWRAEAA